MPGAKAPEPLNPVRFLLDQRRLRRRHALATAPAGSPAWPRCGTGWPTRARCCSSLAGDFLSPSLLSKYYGGRQMVEALNAAKLDYATFGNHEFELPRDTLIARIDESSFKWLSTNCTLADGTRFPKVLPWDTVRVSGHLVGLFGLTLAGRLPELRALQQSRQRRDRRGRHPDGPEGGPHRRAHPPEHRGRSRSARPRAADRPDPGRPRARGPRLGGLRPARAQGRRQLALGPVRYALGWQGRSGGRRWDWSPSTPGSPTTPRPRAWSEAWADSLRKRLGPERSVGHGGGADRRPRCGVPPPRVRPRRPGDRRHPGRHRRRRGAAQRRRACGWTT